MGKIRHKIALNLLSFRTILRPIQQMQYLQPKPNRCQFSQNPNKLKVIINYMPYRVIRLDSYANEQKKTLYNRKKLLPLCMCEEVITLAEDIYSCRRSFLHLPELLHLWKHIIRLVVDYCKFSGYYTRWFNQSKASGSIKTLQNSEQFQTAFITFTMKQSRSSSPSCTQCRISALANLSTLY